MRHIRARYERELRDLKRELTVDLPREIQRAVSMGDLRENAEYTAALERQSYVKARIGQITDKLSRLATIRMAQIPRDRAAFGALVTVRDLASQEEQTYELGLPDENDSAPGLVSASSPLGRALIGRTVGDEVTVQTPGGQRELEIIDLLTLHDRESEENGGEGGDA